VTAEDRYARHLGLFGAEGQEKIAAASAAIIGLGGLGGHVAQQLVYLGLREFLLIDDDVVSMSNLNRLVGAGPADLGEPKVEVAKAMIEGIAPESSVRTAFARFTPNSILLEEPPSVIFGCLDQDPVRLEITRRAAEGRIPYIDLASDVAPGGEFGGRIVFAKNGERCLSCLGELDQRALARAQMAADQRDADDRIYGVDRAALGESGPSVVSVNGVVSSLAVTEFMVWITGMRAPRGYLTYRGDLATVGSRFDPDRGYCHYCMDLWGAAR
jgi:molybdopterin/thiamine biosynthesis adenylyltransferase